MKALELRVPPVLVFLFFASAMYVLAYLLPVGAFEFFGRKWLMWALAGLGLLTGMLAILRFLREGASMNPHYPERGKILVEGGVYNFSRNPMYLALLLVLLSLGLYLGNAFNTLTAALFVAYMNRFQIKPEEGVLESKFGGTYRQYCTVVRRWF